MARLHEYQGKAILAANGFKIPRGRAASTADDAVVAARDLVTETKGGTVVIKIQAQINANFLSRSFQAGPDSST
jgi:succinyl-CoA synthetase beta subunit